MPSPINDARAVSQANFILLRNLLKFLEISGRFKPDELGDLLDGAIQAADDSFPTHGAGEVLRGLKVDLLGDKT